MGCGKPSAWSKSDLTIGGMLDAGTRIRAICTECTSRDVDLAQLIAIKGRDYCLINRRCRCPITPGCGGRVRFYYLCGVYRPLWDEETAMRWLAADAPRRVA